MTVTLPNDLQQPGITARAPGHAAGTATATAASSARRPTFLNFFDALFQNIDALHQPSHLVFDAGMLDKILHPNEPKPACLCNVLVWYGALPRKDAVMIAVRAIMDRAELCGIGRALATTRHLLEMFRRQLRDEKTRRRRQ
jgi:hypothetical protein